MEMEMDVEPIGRFYSMGEVARETGIPAPTIRAWERRYGVPRPERSAGRQRLYSHQDLALLRWLAARQAEGMSIGRAAAAWGHLTVRREAPSAGASQRPAAVPEGRALEDLRSAWVHACLRYDYGLAQSVLAQAFAIHPAEEASVQLLLNGLSEIGEEWFQGRVSVQQEHFASAVALHQIERLVAAAPAPWRRGRILLACPSGELHSLGLRFLALLLRQRGWDTVFLGADVPVEHLDATVAQAKPDLAVLSAQRLPTAETLIEMASTLRELGVQVAYGGRVFNESPTLRMRVPAQFLTEELPEAPRAIERLMDARPSLHRPVEPKAL